MTAKPPSERLGFPDKLSPSNHRNTTGRWFEIRDTADGEMYASTLSHTEALSEAEELVTSIHEGALWFGPLKEVVIIACDKVRIVSKEQGIDK